MRLSKVLSAAAGAFILSSSPVWAQTAPAADTPAKPASASATPADPSAAPAAAAPATAEPATGEPAATTAAPAAASASASGSTAPAGMDGATYVVRLRDLEQRVDELKEQIRRSHTRLSLLSDTILSGGVGGARAEISFKNDMSTAFRLNKALFILDGAVQYNKQDDSGALSAQKEIPIFSGSIPPGDHTLQVSIKLQGHGYGVFSYLKGYNFDVKSSHSFTVTDGKTIQLEAIAWEKGGVTTPLEERPSIRYVEKLRTAVQPGGDAAPAAAPVDVQTSGQTTQSGASGNFSVGTGGK